MALENYFHTPSYLAEKRDGLLIIQQVIERFSDEKPLKGARIVDGHVLALNAMTMVEAFWRGGAEVILTDAHPSPRTQILFSELSERGFPVMPLDQAVQAGDFFVDAMGELGRRGSPLGAVEVTRTGEHFYAGAKCPVISIDRSRVKLLEDYLGTGESFLRAWQEFQPRVPLKGKQLVQFGYGKVGRGLAHHNRRAGVDVTIVDINPAARSQAELDGYPALDGGQNPALQAALARAEVVISVTGVPQAVGSSVPKSWLTANHPVLVNIGFDEYSPAFDPSEVLGGTNALNLLLEHPTQNRYIDPTFAAQVLAVKELALNLDKYSAGIHSLPVDIEKWVLEEWLKFWPNEDLAGIKNELIRS